MIGEISQYLIFERNICKYSQYSRTINYLLTNVDKSNIFILANPSSLCLACSILAGVFFFRGQGGIF